MRCEKCGEYLDELEANMFKQDGSDVWCETGVDENNGVACISVLPNWTGYELSEEEQIDTIRCPYCHCYPFKHRQIDTYTYITVLMMTENAYDNKRSDQTA